MVSDYFAELFVAGLLADKGWNVYFPHRDKGFDFIISKLINNVEVVRPIQVKGKYPTTEKTDKEVYGFIGELTKVHKDMVLAIPFFDHIRTDGTDLVAFMPYSEIKPHARGFRCEPATFKKGKTIARRDFKKYFGTSGLQLIETSM